MGQPNKDIVVMTLIHRKLYYTIWIVISLKNPCIITNYDLRGRIHVKILVSYL